jgi:serine/threonine protein kinase
MMPFFPASLADVISQETETKFDRAAYSDEWRLKLIDGILLGVYFIHANNYFHRDLKPDNIMLSEEGYPMISDFGFSKEFSNDQRSMIGSPKYMAPEIIAGQTDYDSKVDVFSLGIMLFEIFNMKSPIDVKSMTKQQILDYCSTANYPQFSVEWMELSVYCQNYSQLVSNMIQTDPQQRTPFIQVFRQWINYRHSVLEQSHTLEQQIYDQAMQVQSDSSDSKIITEPMDVDEESTNMNGNNLDNIPGQVPQYQHVVTTTTFFYATSNDPWFNYNFQQMFLMLQNKFMEQHLQQVNQLHLLI